MGKQKQESELSCGKWSILGKEPVFDFVDAGQSINTSIYIIYG